MPTYDYACDHCATTFEVLKRMDDAAKVESCGTCGRHGRRLFSSGVQFIGTSVQHAEYNPAFGKVVKNKYERSELAKRKNLIEIGNEKPETMHKMADETRSDIKKKRWDSV